MLPERVTLPLIVSLKVSYHPQVPKLRLGTEIPGTLRWLIMYVSVEMEDDYNYICYKIRKLYKVKKNN